MNNEDKERKIEEPQQEQLRDAPGHEDSNQSPLRTDPEIQEANTHNNDDQKKKKHTSAASLDAIISSPTDAVRSRRHTDTLGNTGTNTSYEGPTSTSPVGTGYNSGQSGTGARIEATGAYEAGHIEKKNEHEKDDAGNDVKDENDERDII